VKVGGKDDLAPEITLMSEVTISNLNRTEFPPLLVKYCDSYMCRLRGLMFSPPVPPGCGLLLIYPRDSRLESAIHMLFMRCDLAVIWINSDCQVVDKVLALKWKPAYSPTRPARFVLETHPSHLDDFDIGDRVQIRGNHAI
jgi:uncharacterized membrane protein (UPF0127 family)